MTHHIQHLTRMDAALPYLKAAILAAVAGAILFFLARPPPPPPPPPPTTTRQPTRPMIEHLPPIMEHPPRADTPGVLAQPPPPTSTTSTSTTTASDADGVNTDTSTTMSTTASTTDPTPTPRIRSAAYAPAYASFHLAATHPDRARQHALTDAKRAHDIAIGSRRREIARSEATLTKLARGPGAKGRAGLWELELRWMAWLRRDLEGIVREGGEGGEEEGEGEGKEVGKEVAGYSTRGLYST